MEGFFVLGITLLFRFISFLYFFKIKIATYVVYDLNLIFRFNYHKPKSYFSTLVEIATRLLDPKKKIEIRNIKLVD
jgi:hypothetical protein